MERALSLHYKTNDENEGYVWDSRDPAKELLPLSDIDTKILIYEDRVKHWFLDYAKKLLDFKHADFIVLAIIFSQIEGMAKLLKGTSTKKQQPRTLFMDGLKKIVGMHESGDNKLPKKFYDIVRCGLFHDGFTKKGVGITRDIQKSTDIDTKNNILINPQLLLESFEKYFSEYIKKLQDKRNREDRSNFKDTWYKWYKM